METYLINTRGRVVKVPTIKVDFYLAHGYNNPPDNPPKLQYYPDYDSEYNKPKVILRKGSDERLSVIEV